VRDFWRSTPGTLADFATRITGSSDLYGRGRRPTASVNLVTVHDGFTLSDLVSYDSKHNQANGEGNRDGSDDNRSWNCGVEGATDDPAVLALRARQRRNLLATVLLSEGVPLLLGGDELGRTQGGNNNAYCQDNAISWVDWAAADTELIEFVARLCRLRREQPILRRTRFFGPGDVRWLRPDGMPMEAGDWSNPDARAVSRRGRRRRTSRQRVVGPADVPAPRRRPLVRRARHRRPRHSAGRRRHARAQRPLAGAPGRQPRDARSPRAMAGCQRNSWLISTTLPSGSVV
jgi:glycogen debranching enzyme GlgX